MLSQRISSVVATVGLLCSTAVVTAVAVLAGPGIAKAEVCPPGLNSVPYSLNTPLQGTVAAPSTLTFFGGAMTFRGRVNGSATWGNGVQVQNQPISSTLTDNVIYLQPQNAASYLTSGNSAEYTMTFPTALSSLSLRGAGLNFADGTTLLPSFQGTPIPISAANFSNLTPAGASAIHLIDSAFDADTDMDTVIGSATTGGTDVDTNLFQFDITGPIDQLVIRSGKSDTSTSTVTIALHTILACQPELRLVKSVSSITDNGDGLLGEGDVINYSFAVSNLSEVTLTHLVVTDPNAVVSGGPLAALAPNATNANTFTASHTLTELDVAAGGVENRATVTATGPGGSTITDLSDAGTSASGATVADPSGTETPSPLGDNANSPSSPTDDPTTLLIPGVVSGHLYIDTNGNVTQDVGEPDLANVDVIVTGSNSVVQTVSTDASGNWSATVPPGATTADVDETDPQYPTGYTQTEGDDPTTVTAVAGTRTPAGNDGYLRSGTVSGHLYLDTNGDGSQDVGEPDLADVDVIVTDVNGVDQTVTTDSDGDWSATVPPGSTSVDVDETDGQFPTGAVQTQGVDPTAVTAVAGSDVPAGVDGYFVPATVSGHLYIDTNGDGTQDVGEPDLADVDVVVTDVNGNDRTVATDSEGDWSAAVPPGSTSADVDESDPQYPTGYAQTEGDDATTVTAVAGADVSAGNDGYYLAGSVSGHLYIDTNGDGSQDVGEPDLAGVDVIVTDSNRAVRAVTSDASGNWTAAVPPGSTTANVDESDPQYPTGYVQTQGTDPSTVAAVAGTNRSAGIDGYFQPAGLHGHLYVDTNGNGTKDPGEPDLPGVDVVVTDANGVVTTVTTDAGGNWSVRVPPGPTTIDVDESDPQYPAHALRIESLPATVNAQAGVSSAVGNEGYFVARSGTVSGHVYIDTNGNGRQEPGEPNLSDVDVIFVDSDGATRTVASDASGNWFAVVRPGNVAVHLDESDPQYPVGSRVTQGVAPLVVIAAVGVDIDAGDIGLTPPATPAPPVVQSTLPQTGSGRMPLEAFAALIALGLALIAVSRRRQELDTTRN